VNTKFSRTELHVVR